MTKTTNQATTDYMESSQTQKSRSSSSLDSAGPESGGPGHLRRNYRSSRSSGSSTEVSGEFPGYFYAHLSGEDLEFLRGLGECQFTRCYWYAVTTGTLGVATRPEPGQIDRMFLEILGENGYTWMDFDCNGALVSVRPFRKNT